VQWKFYIVGTLETTASEELLYRKNVSMPKWLRPFTTSERRLDSLRKSSLI
jgi:hypothetical protein